MDFTSIQLLITTIWRYSLLSYKEILKTELFIVSFFHTFTLSFVNMSRYMTLFNRFVDYKHIVN